MTWNAYFESTVFLERNAIQKFNHNEQLRVVLPNFRRSYRCWDLLPALQRRKELRRNGHIHIAFEQCNDQALKAWQAETAFSKQADFVFASFKLDGEKPRVGNMIVEEYLRPAAIKAGVIKVVNGETYDMAGNVLKRFGFHAFRHTLV